MRSDRSKASFIWTAAALLFLLAMGGTVFAFLRLVDENDRLRRELAILREQSTDPGGKAQELPRSPPPGTTKPTSGPEPEPPSTPSTVRVGILVTNSAGWLPRQGHTSLVYADRIWVFGGDAGSGDFHSPSRYQPMNDVWSSPDGKTWTEVVAEAPWLPRRNHAAVIFGKKMWVLGGEDPETHRHFNDVWSSSDGAHWELATAEAAWEARRGQAVVVYGGNIWVLGGATAAQYLDDVWSSADGATWRQADTSPKGEESEKETDFAPWSARYLHAAAVFRNKIWILGGGFKNDVWASPDGKKWEAVTKAAPWNERQYHSAVVTDGQLCILGGNKGPIPSSGLWCSSDGTRWQEPLSNTPWGARTGHTAVYFDHRIWILGGLTGEKKLTSDVWSF